MICTTKKILKVGGIFALFVTRRDFFTITDDGETIPTLHAPRWSGTFSANYTLARSNLSIDLTGTWYGPQWLPALHQMNLTISIMPKVMYRLLLQEFVVFADEVQGCEGLWVCGIW